MYFEKRADPIPLPPKPYVLSPSGSFDGNDGKWSTFFVNIGDGGTGNGQNFKVLISTSSPLTLVPQQTEWCDEDCAKNRGMLLFNGEQPLGLEQSQYWKTAGLYDIPLPYWWTNDMATNSTDTLGGVWGSENLGMGESSPQSPILQEQYVVKYTFEEFFLGSLGLAVGEVGPPGGSKPNFVNNFYKPGNQIASTSYGYTAGAYYRNNGRGVLGNLVLGGYDKSRLTAQGISIRMPSEKNNTLVVGIQSILYAPDQDVEANTFSFTRGGFEANIDSTLPYLILPDDICDQFQQRFQLQFDEDRRLYTVNASAHEWNLQQNATVSLKIGAGPRDSDIFTTVVLPYAAFDQQISFPITDQATQYFPIRKSDNGMYVLGRTFLQEAYIIVDYERANFTVAPAQFSEPMLDESLVTIFNKTYVGITPEGSPGSGLSAGAIAGIVVGIVLAFIIAGLGAFFWWKKRRDAKKNDLLQYEKPSEIDTVSAGNEVKYRRVSELTGSEAPQSPKTSTTGYYTNDHKSIPPISEMSPESPPAELYSPPPDVVNKDNSHDYFGVTLAELPGDEGRYQNAGQNPDVGRPLHGRGPSDASLPTNIDEVLASKQKTSPKATKEKLQLAAEPGDATTADESTKSKAAVGFENDEQEQIFPPERRPSHARGLSDTTVQSDSTAVSQPTPEELERWARSVDDGPTRPLSP
ncbi:Nn.00g103350.m01.CDS01 [Neocucurbitaria sp. VM-36]